MNIEDVAAIIELLPSRLPLVVGVSGRVIVARFRTIEDEVRAFVAGREIRFLIRRPHPPNTNQDKLLESFNRQKHTRSWSWLVLEKYPTMRAEKDDKRESHARIEDSKPQTSEIEPVW